MVASGGGGYRRGPLGGCPSTGGPSPTGQPVPKTFSGTLRLAEQTYALHAGRLSLVLRGWPPLVRTFLNVELRSNGPDGLDPSLESASWIRLPSQPLYSPGARVDLDVPLHDEAGSSFHLMAYVEGHFPVREARLGLEGLAPGRARLTLSGLVDPRLDEGMSEDVPISVDAELTLREVSALDAESAEEAQAIAAAAGLPPLTATKSHWGFVLRP